MNHLSNSGKEIKKDSDVPESPKVAASEIGISPNRFNGVVGPRGDDPKSKKSVHSRKVWEGLPKSVKAAYAKWTGLFDAVPEYGEARETLSESGSTTIQG